MRENDSDKEIIINIICYILCCGIAGLCLTLMKTPSDAALKILLAPYAKAVEVYYNIEMTYIEGLGYTSAGLQFVVGENCSGVSYIAIVFCMMICMFLHRFRGRQKIMWILINVPVAAALGIFTTCLRILGSVPIAGYARFSTIHAGIGISFYLAGMIACLLTAEKATSKYQNTIREGVARFDKK